MKNLVHQQVQVVVAQTTGGESLYRPVELFEEIPIHAGTGVTFVAHDMIGEAGEGSHLLQTA